MIAKYATLYQDMLDDIKLCLGLDCPEKENVEDCFWIARNYWSQLQCSLKGSGFENEEAEMIFYKEVKPFFASYIEYFSLLSEALQFEPPLVPVPVDFPGNADKAVWTKAWQSAVRDYWMQEEKRKVRFYHKNQVFLDYCESGCHENDRCYFLAAVNQPDDLSRRRTHNRDTNLFTEHEELLTTWLAFKMYGEYIKKRIHEHAHSGGN